MSYDTLNHRFSILPDLNIYHSNYTLSSPVTYIETQTHPYYQMSPYQEDVVDVPSLTKKLAALTLEDDLFYPEMLRPSKNPISRFHWRMEKTRSPTMRHRGYKGVRSNLGRYEVRGAYCIGLENYRMIHFERYLHIYCRPQYIPEHSPLSSILETETISLRETSQWYNGFRDIANGKIELNLPLLDSPTNEMFRDWSYRIDGDTTENTINLLDRFAAWDSKDTAIIGEDESNPNVLVTRKIAIQDLVQIEGRIPESFTIFTPYIKLAIKEFLKIEFGVVEYDF
ncbi:uncharacterized protein GGS22DRAFT_190168 [Annulohypoxylon maeteangense]|uniref:uncharacterized protein n=1 Tax=Annulohypoxylon maeteangense TaxID=1927788 RepID=UPI002008B50E|nr:uncharacterized protein GGS22DRAFT_190168 [Annulohypoxylon maeteangense]KAI0883509.1 hypothetical protein GGS22DRAFT_190168 [Annulohypoxylon maeteangense]